MIQFLLYVDKFKKIDIFILILKVTTFNYRKICAGFDKLKHLTISETFTAVTVLNLRRVAPK